MKFTIHKKDSKSNIRLLEFETAHGIVETPIFMPVGTWNGERDTPKRN